MSYRISQLSPRTSTREIKMKIAVQRRWSDSLTSPDANFLRSWLEYDSDLDEDIACGGINWGAISGLALALAVSATFWVGLGWVLREVWK